MLDFVLKVGLGVALFTVILWFAQGRHPRVAGMMLTFPALNGLGLLTGRPSDLMAMAAAMVPMIAANGLLCWSYIWFYPRLSSGPSRLHAVGLMAVCLLVWGGAAVILAPTLQDWLVGTTSLLLFALVYVVATSRLTMIVWRPVPAQVVDRQSWWQSVQSNWDRIMGLAVLLVLVMLCVKIGASTWAGRLSALPVLPLYALVTMALTPTASPTAAPLQWVGGTVLLGPVVAIVFVASYVGYLLTLACYVEGSVYMMGGVAGLLVGWSSCGAAIWGMLMIASKLELVAASR